MMVTGAGWSISIRRDLGRHCRLREPVESVPRQAVTWLGRADHGPREAILYRFGIENLHEKTARHNRSLVALTAHGGERSVASISCKRKGTPSESRGRKATGPRLLRDAGL